jgi:hypothetical protein
MGKLTQKLDAALKTLGMKYNPLNPNIVVYGKLAERGYAWDGEKWARNGFGDLSYPALIKVVAQTYLCTEKLADVVAAHLHQQGLRVTMKAPKEALHTTGFCVFIEVE